MQKHQTFVPAIILILCLALVPVAAFSFSSLFKGLFTASSTITARAVDNSQTTYCGNYNFSTPQRAVASSMLGIGFNETKAIDKDTTTRWVGNNSLPYPKWLYVDIGEKKCINAAEVFLLSFDAPITMDIEVSDDAQNWTVVASDWSVSSGGSYQMQQIAETRARYIKFYQKSGPNTYGSLAEVRINNAQILTNTSAQQQSNTSTTSGCTDSDGGKNYTLKGTVTVSNVTSGKLNTYEDGCYSENGLFEYFCEGGNTGLQTLNCEAGCDKGACLSLAVSSAQNINNSSEDNNERQNSQDSSLKEEQSESSLQCGEYEYISPRSATASSQFHNFRAANSLDGDANTHWFGDPQQSYPKWISFDLGRQKCINAVDLTVFLWDAPVKLDIQTSLDNKNWATLQSDFIINDGGVSIKKEFSETQARYLRIVEKEGRRTYGTLSEIKVNAAPYGAEAGVQLKVKNVIGEPTLDKFYEINSKRAYLEIDGKPVELYFP